MESDSHEMNLFDLIAAFFRALGRFLRSLFRLCGNAIRLSVWYWYLTVALLLIGAGAALYWSRPSNRLYKAGVLVKLNGPQRDDVREALRPLQFATPDCISAEQSVASLLGLSQEDAAPLRDFVCLNVIDCRHDSIADFVDMKGTHDLSDTSCIVMPNHLYLQFRTTRPEQAKQTGDALLSYLNGKAALQAEYDGYVTTLRREAEFCRTQIDKLDSLTTSFYFEQGTGQQIQRSWHASALVVGEREINLLHPEILELIQSTKRTTHELSTATAPVVAKSDFVIDPRPVNGPLKCLAIGLACGYVLSCLLAWAVEEKKRIGLWLKRQ